MTALVDKIAGIFGLGAKLSGMPDMGCADVKEDIKAPREEIWKDTGWFNDLVDQYRNRCRMWRVRVEINK